MIFKFSGENFFMIFAAVSLAFLLSFNSLDTIKEGIMTQNKFNYTGTNSLYIEYDKGLKFNWITSVADIGYYELLDSDNTLISKGETEFGRVHTIFIDYEIKSTVTFKFGGINENIYKVKLRAKSDLNDAIYKNVDSLYVVGDVHGRYKQLIDLLINSKVINKDLNWIAGKSNLVFLGDLFDRGNDVTKVLWFVYELEAKAKAEGGKVHLVLGNHEIMTMTNDLRYIGQKEATIPIAYGTTYDYMFHPSKSFLGLWLSSKPSVLKINNALFAHGGIIDLGNHSIDEFNQKAFSYIKNSIFLDIMKEHADSTKYDPLLWMEIESFFYSNKSPFWYRGYVNSDTISTQLNSMLKKYNSKIHVVAHTPLESITQKYKGKLITTDLNDAATQLLLLVKRRNKYSKFKIDSSGKISALD
jgi:calcineurin-like phosphoesterase family protein